MSTGSDVVGTSRGPQAGRNPRRVVVNASGIILREHAGATEKIVEGEAAGFGTGAVNEPLDWHVVPVRFTGIHGLKDFNIRNGDPRDVSSLLVQAAIPRTYHWVVIQDLDPRFALDIIDVFAKCAYVQMKAHPTGSWTEDEMRRNALVLGTARAAMTKYYRIAAGDIIPGEVGKPMLRMVAPTEEGGLPSFSLLPGLTEEQRQILLGGWEFKEDETNAVNALVRCGVAALPLQGFSLTMVGHHYISEAASPSRKAFLAVEKQIWSGGSVSGFFSTGVERLQDILWHKAGHPVLMSLKIQMAQEERVKEILIKAQIGSAAARLPAEEAELRAASAYMSAIDNVNPILAGCGGGVNATYLLDAIAKAKKGRNSVNVTNEAGDMLGTERALALAELKVAMERSAASVAWCYGFFVKMMDQDTLTGGKEIRDTLRSSYALNKLAQNYVACYQDGKAAYVSYDYTKARQKRRGGFQSPVVILGKEVTLDDMQWAGQGDGAGGN